MFAQSEAGVQSGTFVREEGRTVRVGADACSNLSACPCREEPECLFALVQGPRRESEFMRSGVRRSRVSFPRCKQSTEILSSQPRRL